MKNFPTKSENLLKSKLSILVCLAGVGAVDGTLIPIKGMSGTDEPAYVCRKNFHALNIQAVADARMRLVAVYST